MTGLLYDVHGNLPALEAVLEEARTDGVEGWVLGGDYSSFGGWPRECVERLRELPGALWLRGNWERWQGGDDADMPAHLRAAAEAARAALGPTLVAELAAAPDRAAREDVLFVHASPRDDMASFLPEPQEGEEELLAGARERRIVFGHLHLQFTRPGPGGIELIGPGSVGLPFDSDPRAAWALMGDDGRVELRRTEYDVERAVAAVDAPAARRLREARF